MPHGEAAVADVLLIAYLKEQSGKRIEQARKREGVTQRQLAIDLGMGVRWLREIESGNPRARLEDHLRCTYELQISTGHILIPLLFFGQDMEFPEQLTGGDLRELERVCVDAVAARITLQVTPAWRRPPAATAG